MSKSITYILELTKNCNNNCKYCYNVWKADDSYPKEELDTELWKKVIEKLIHETRPRLFGISGGEPFLREDIFEILKQIKKYEIPVVLITNGTLLSKEIVKKCLDNGINNFELTLLSSSLETHDNLTRHQGSWKKVIESIIEIKKQRGKATVVIVVTKKNFTEIKETTEIAIALGADAILVNYFNIGGEGIKYKNELMVSIEELREAFQKINGLADEYEIPISSGVPVPECILDISEFKNIRFGDCQIGGNFPYYAIDPAGNIRPCNHSALILGNVLNQTVGEILKNRLFCEYKESYPKECVECIKLKECKGGCRASAEVYYRDLTKFSPFILENFKGKIK